MDDILQMIERSISGETYCINVVITNTTYAPIVAYDSEADKKKIKCVEIRNDTGEIIKVKSNKTHPFSLQVGERRVIVTSRFSNIELARASSSGDLTVNCVYEC